MKDSVQNVLDKGAVLADKASQKGLELCEIAKINLKISEIKLEIKRKYTELGKLTYDAFLKEEAAFSNEMIDIKKTIDEDLNRIRIFKEELARIKGVKSCGGCGSENKKDAKYCDKCGKEL